MKLNCEIDKKNVIRQENVDKKSTKEKKFNDEKKIKRTKNRINNVSLLYLCKFDRFF